MSLLDDLHRSFKFFVFYLHIGTIWRFYTTPHIFFTHHCNVWRSLSICHTTMLSYCLDNLQNNCFLTAAARMSNRLVSCERCSNYSYYHVHLVSMVSQVPNSRPRADSTCFCIAMLYAQVETTRKANNVMGKAENLNHGNLGKCLAQHMFREWTNKFIYAATISPGIFRFHEEQTRHIHSFAFIRAFPMHRNYWEGDKSQLRWCPLWGTQFEIF